MPANRRVLPYVEREDLRTGARSSGKKWVVVETPAIVDGTDLRNAVATPSRIGTEYYQIVFSLGPSGANKFGVWTGAHIDNYIGVVLNDEVKSIAYIKSQIFDQGEITGKYTKHAAEDLALILRTGSLPAPARIVEERALPGKDEG